MERYIDVDKLLKDVKNATPMNWTNSEAEIQAQLDWKCFTALTKGQPTADVAEVKWIDANERLPENYMNCLVYYKHAYSNEDGYWAIGISYYNGEKFLIDWVYQVTHWMPLPEPPNSAKMDGGKEE